MSPLVPIPVIVPLLAAAALTMVATKLPRRIAEGVAFAVALATTGTSAALLVKASDHRVVYWFAGWRPHHGVAIGIDFAVDAVGAGAALLVCVLFTAALMFSWRYFEDTVDHRYLILMLVFLGAMNGFALTGDLFDLFVFFELMSVAAYALTAYRIAEQGPLQGGLNFAIVNSLGSFAILLGIALIYAHTGALNFAQIGETLRGQPASGVVVVAFVLILVGLFVKASVVPFHFWLADAHAVAPPTVCVLFSGVMVELGLYGAARLYWTTFHDPFAAHAVDLGRVLIGFGVVTAMVGAVMCFLQQHLKRLLAYSTISHIGLFLIGFGLLNHVSTAGVAMYVVSHGLVKGALFLLAGILIYRLAGIDEEGLRGRGRELVGTAVLFAVGGLALAEVPPFGTSTGKTLIEDAGATAGYLWLPWVFAFAAALTAGAVLRSAGRIFLGWGPDEPDRFGSERAGEREAGEEMSGPRDSTPATMWIPAALLLTAALALGLASNASARLERAAASFQDGDAYRAAVLHGERGAGAPVAVEDPKPSGIWYGLATGAAAIAVAAFALFRRQLISARVRRSVRAGVAPQIRRLRLLHSGHVGDYAAWFVAGLAALGGLMAMATR